MVRAWYMDDEKTDHRLEHHRNPPKFITIEELFKICGVEYFPINVKTCDEDGVLDEIKEKRGYTFQDEITCTKENLPNYEEKLKNFYTEHLHTEEETRLVLEGSGYYDVRNSNEEWIRIEVLPGDMLVLPKGLYHRFTKDTKDFIRVRRFFIGKSIWTPHNRPADDMECRKEYLEHRDSGFITS